MLLERFAPDVTILVRFFGESCNPLARPPDKIGDGAPGFALLSRPVRLNCFGGISLGRHDRMDLK